MIRLFAPALLLGFAAVLGGAAHQTWPDWWWRFSPPAPAQVFAQRIQPFVQKSCYECHDAAAQKGGFVLERLAASATLKTEREAWERVLKHVSNQLMPPLEAAQPTQAERADFVTWLDRALHPIDPDHPDPGHVVIRRLNREEYKNTVQDLFGVTFNPAESFPEDDGGYGFDHIGDILSVSPLLFERYLAAAEQIASAVIPDPMPPPRIFTAPADAWTGNDNIGGDPARFSNGDLAWSVQTPAAGRYRLKLRVYEDHVGEEPARFALQVAGRTLQELPANASRRKPREHHLELDLPAGENTLALRFLNDSHRPAENDRKAQDRNLYLAEASLEGPYPRPGQKRPEGPLPAWIGEPRAGETRREWIIRVFTPVVRRAFRRPPQSGELDRLAALAQQSEAAGDSPAAALQVALQAVLISPSFLFRGEAPDASQRIQALSDHALATRLAYFLWSGPPDERLLDLADRGRLKAQLSAETARLLADPRAKRLVSNFAGQWLEVRNLPLRTPDPGVFPDWSPSLAAAMKEETLRFFGDFLTNQRSLSELLTADYTFLNAQLAAHYGLTAPAGPDAWTRVVLPPGRRAGILGQAGVLTVTSYPNRTSPVLRGKFVLDKILGTPPPPPPPNIPSLAEHGAEGLPQTLRGRLELHRSKPSCAACHALIDPIGFALEHYDATGRRRETDAGRPIDSTGTLLTGESVRSPEELSTALVTAKSREFYHNFAATLLTYALGRGTDYQDRPTIELIVATAARRNHTLPAYIDAVVASVAFQYQRAEAPATAPAANRVALQNR